MAAMVCIAGIAGILVYSIVVANQLTGLIGLCLATVLAFYGIRADLGLLWIIFGLTLAFEAGRGDPPGRRGRWRRGGGRAGPPPVAEPPARRRPVTRLYP